MADGNKVRWGIVSTANIGVQKVIPGMLKSPHSEVVALASRDLARAHTALSHLGLRGHARAYAPMAATRNCSPTPWSMRSTTRCPTTCTCR
jgi:predicted dehydrogenase